MEYSAKPANRTQERAPDAGARNLAPTAAHAADSSPRGEEMRGLAQLMQNGPAAAARRAELGTIFGGAIQLKGKIDEEPLQAASAGERPLQAAALPRSNDTGLPDSLKAGVEALSGMSMDGVKVHFNSAQPAQLNALAFAQGPDIHLGPGQEHHLPHEAWHVVQQAQGRVKPTLQAKGAPINDDPALEREADAMGARAAMIGSREPPPSGASSPQTRLPGGHGLQADRMSAQRVIQRQQNFQTYAATKIAANHPNFNEAKCVAALLDNNEYDRKEILGGKISDNQILSAAIASLKTKPGGNGTPSGEDILKFSSGQLMQYLNKLMGAGGPVPFSNIQWGPATPWGAGTGVIAHFHSGGHANGSDAGGDPTWMLNLQQRVDQAQKSLYVRGHLLNRHLGGPGLDYNMVPLTASGAWGANDANGAHSSSIEETVKNMFEKLETKQEDQVTNLAYNVTAKYGRTARSQTTQITNLYVTFTSIEKEFRKLIATPKLPNNIDTASDDDIKRLWLTTNEAMGVKNAPFPPNGAYDKQATINALILGHSNASANTAIQSLPDAQKLFVVQNIRKVAGLESVLRAASANNNYMAYTLSNLTYRMRENLSVWKLEDQCVPTALTLTATWEQFGNKEDINDELKIRLPSSLNAALKLRNE